MKQILNDNEAPFMPTEKTKHFIIESARLKEDGEFKSFVNLGKEIGIGGPTLSNIRNGRADITPDAYRKFCNLYLNGNITGPNVDTNRSIEKESPVGINEEIKDLEMKALLDITKIYAESHVGLVRSHENLTISHKHSLEDNSLLISMVERKIYTNYDGAKENQQESFLAQPPLLMRLADGGVGTFWKSRGEGLIALGNMLAVDDLVKK